MSPRIRNPRPGPPKPPDRRRPGTQVALDDRCVACAAGSHKNCRSPACTCADPSHHTPEGPSGRLRGSQGPLRGSDDDPHDPSSTDDTHRETT